MKALVLAPFTAECLKRLERRMTVLYESWLDSRRLYSPEELGERLDAERAELLVVEGDFVFAEVFERASSLRFVGVCRNAVSHVDLEAATRCGVTVVNTPGRNAAAVAELSLGLMLSLAHRIPSSHHIITSGQWRDPVSSYIELRGTELAGKTAGIIGLGTIGAMVARRLKPMEMTVLAYDPYIDSEAPEAQLVGLKELLTRSDFVTIHVPDTSDSYGLIGADELALMKPSAFLINTSSAAAVDSQALIRVLEEGHIAGAALDVFDVYPLPPNSPLLRMDNVVLTPHIGGATHETIRRYSEMMTDDIERFLDGTPPQHLVNPQVWRRDG